MRIPVLHGKPVERPASGEIHFPNGNRARWVGVPTDADPEAVLQALRLPRPQALLLLLGGADEMDPAIGTRLRQLISRGLAQAADEADALILDGGTHAGVMALMGQGVADRGHHPLLVGVAPSGRVAFPAAVPDGQAESQAELDPNHSHFVLVDGNNWGGETQMMFRLASVYAHDIPILVVVVNGGSIAREEVLRAVRRRWPIVVLQGSGRLADELTVSLQAPEQDVADPVMAEIIADGNLHLFPIDGSPEAFARLVLHHLGTRTSLHVAWQRFATYDANANREQAFFRRLQFWIFFLGILSTALALVLTYVNTILDPGGDSVARLILHTAVVMTAAAVTALLAASSRFKAGSKWIFLRATAEALKREIYRYRAGLAFKRLDETHERKFVEQMRRISSQMLRTESGSAVLRSYQGPLPPPKGAASEDDGFSPLTPARYIHFRVDDQLDFYRRRVDELARRNVALQWVIIVFGAGGTVLAALPDQLAALWVPLTTAVVMALTAYFGYQQSESKILKYQQAATDLENLKTWWCTLSLEEHEDPRNFEALVEGVEAILQSELTGWVQEMKEALVRVDTRNEREARRRGAKPQSPDKGGGAAHGGEEDIRQLS
ncbi:DUF4231 domain-containing protein [Vitiosangium sp. GDMCC 1.1324]|uniref:DUF4231 domain-containing protein n=1 Tax=Vitiosangium sp. (strain GDMCC 1.1324) TaxID=2138576 RepID=UPI000D371FAF|nr:DUF4231 domain-containing protein [Vitiosangium sp. GDMCC 1.1324]PTL77851.1 hypothetical protein DAT35_42385 [Vitiosangium sp. GDMCC 1.1324]